jgi:hypothetical protein
LLIEVLFIFLLDSVNFSVQLLLGRPAKSLSLRQQKMANIRKESKKR